MVTPTNSQYIPIIFPKHIKRYKYQGSQKRGKRFRGKGKKTLYGNIRNVIGYIGGFIVKIARVFFTLTRVNSKMVRKQITRFDRSGSI